MFFWGLSWNAPSTPATWAGRPVLVRWQLNGTMYNFKNSFLPNFVCTISKPEFTVCDIHFRKLYLQRCVLCLPFLSWKSRCAKSTVVLTKTNSRFSAEMALKQSTIDKIVLLSFLECSSQSNFKQKEKPWELNWLDNFRALQNIYTVG